MPDTQKAAAPKAEMLKAEIKTGRTKYGAADSRSRDRVPGIVYAKGSEPVMIEMDRIAFKKTIAAGKRIFEIEIAGQGKTHVQLKELQYKAPWEEIIHCDFLKIAPGQKVRVAVPIVLTGVPEGKKKGGVTDWMTRQIEVTCLPDMVPENFVVDITKLDLNDVLKASEIKLPSGVAFTHRSANLTIVNVKMPKEEKVVEGEATDLQPEVIGAKPAEGEEGEEGAAAAGGAAAGGAPAKAAGGKEGGDKAAAKPAAKAEKGGDKGKK
ncbi:MAG TPA: 50S ribosomal protein L25 [Planctomycetota bacterium]|nr:50S ribosomal protein L25 [Planctomycetota bacterium]